MNCCLCTSKESTYSCPVCDNYYCDKCANKLEYRCHMCSPPPLREIQIKKEEDPFKKADDVKDLKDIKMMDIKSSNVSEIGWANGTLRVQFKSGQVYEYLSVPEGYYKSITTPGTSVGSAIAMIKKNFRSRRIGSVG